MNGFAIAKIILQFFPLAIQAVQAVESMLPQGGNGAKKAELAKQVLQQAFSTVQGVEVTFEQLWPSLEPIIAGIVIFANTTGIFHHGVAPVAPAANPTTGTK